MKFNDITWKPHQVHEEMVNAKNIPDSIKKDFIGSMQGRYESENHIPFSILKGSMFYSNGVDTYEIWIIDGGIRASLGSQFDDPAGYLSEDEIVEYINDAIAGYKPTSTMDIIDSVIDKMTGVKK